MSKAAVICLILILGVTLFMLQVGSVQLAQAKLKNKVLMLLLTDPYIETFVNLAAGTVYIRVNGADETAQTIHVCKPQTSL